MVKNVWTRWSPSGPLFGASANLTRAAYVPFLILVALGRTSVCFVLSPVPDVDVSRFMTELPAVEEKVTFCGAQVAPGTPGPPELERTLQPWAAMSGSSYAL